MASTADIRTRIKRWWPVPTAIAAGLLAESLVKGAYDVSGHAAEHLASAPALCIGTSIVAIILWATPAARRQLDVLLPMGGWLAAEVLVLVGNLRVVDTLVDAGYGHEPTSTVPDIADHGLAKLGMWLAVAAAVLAAGALWRRRHIGVGAAIGSVVLSLLFPPWIAPGFGMGVVVVARCRAHGRAMAQAPDSDLGGSIRRGAGASRS